MAQPLKENIPPFILQIFGTDNKFTGKNVTKRWKYIRKELEKYGIEIVGISSDGDTRLLSSMIYSCNLSNKAIINEENLSPYFNCSMLTIFIQDTIHILTKLRNRMLKRSICLPLGNKQISVGHLKLLINTVKIDKHGLVLKDICPDDRQNYRSVEKMLDPRVSEQLKKNIPDSEATVFYLKLLSDIKGFEDPSLLPEDLLYRMLHTAFFFRIWKWWLNQIIS